MDWINNILSGDLVEIWIAPIVTGIFVLLVGYIVQTIWKRNKITKQLDTIKIAEMKLVDLVRPFIIEGLTLSDEILNDIRDSVIKEYSMDEEHFMSLSDLKKYLIYDISNTRYIDEFKKIELINGIAQCFNFLHKESSLLEKLKTEEITKNLKIEKSKLSLRLYTSLSIGVAMMFCILIVIFLPDIFFTEVKMWCKDHVLFTNFMLFFASMIVGWAIGSMHEEHKNNNKIKKEKRYNDNINN